MTQSYLIIASLLTAGLGVLVLRRSTFGYAMPIATSALCLLIALLTVVYLGSDFFTGAGIDESVLYQFKYGLQGAGFGEYLALAATLGALLLISFTASIYIYRLLRRPSHGHSKIASYTGSILVLFALAVNPAVADLIEVFRPATSIEVPDDSDFAKFYSTPQLKPIAQPKNLVFLYLEGLERTYFDESRFPGMVPGLKSLEKQGTSFTNVRQVWGTGWTIGGITASQCGIPLVTPRRGQNSMSGMDEFISGAVCIGDLLKEQGYSLNFMGGAKLSYAGKGQFYRTHGFNSVRGFHEMKEHLRDPEYKSYWGLYDDILLDLAWQRFEQLSKSEQPFGLFLLTLDTHNPGLASRRCDGLIYGDGSSRILNAVQCTDKLVSQFIHQIQTSDRGPDTIIVMVSDHLAMRSTASDLLKQGPRRNLFITLTPKQESQSVDKLGSTLDVGATVLSTVGFDVGAIGLGRNLLRSDTTLAETYEKPDKMLKAWSDDVARFWNYPALSFGVTVDSKLKQLRFGDRVLKTPTLVTINDELVIGQVTFPFRSHMKLIEHANEMALGESIIWVDRCDHVSVLSSSLWIPSKKTCVGVGRLGADNFTVRQVDDLTTLRRAEIAHLVKDSGTIGVDSAVKNRLSSMANFGDPEILEIVMSSNKQQFGELIVRSAGYGQGQTFVKSDMADHALTEFTRGLTLVGIGDNAELSKLAHVDSCEPTRPKRDAQSLDEPFADVMHGMGDKFSAYLVVAFDSARCDKSFDMEALFDRLPLTKWKQIGFRTPYVGVIASGGEVYEKVGLAGTSVALRLMNFIPINENEKLDNHLL